MGKEQQYLSLAKTLRRAGVSTVLHPLLRREIEHRQKGIKRAEELQDAGFGLVILFNHFSEKDPVQVIKLILENHKMRRHPLVIPVAAHMYDHHNKPIRFLAKTISATLCPIVTGDSLKNESYTRAHPKNKRGQGLLFFLNEAFEVLGNGGISVMAPQGGRREFLGEPEIPTVGTFLAYATRKGVSNLGFLFVGVSMAEEDNFGASGLNPFKKYRLTVGDTLTAWEIMELAGNDFKKVDSVVFSKLSDLLPPSYLTPNTQKPQP